ncbi:putative aminotriazole resistance protein [Mollisia scopiformis]|uniref:Putative aminotriazole resistance protein n=1 Tax=Mollisia scopiformis TaxID=149040 RepID=A0A194X126_MOLSC|nr:putative aminotriazole resistance protein [Mollisia scopiformis]KUJ13896.1 putative aminotriazole resistance protein [Mollisia scopiformis]
MHSPPTSNRNDGQESDFLIPPISLTREIILVFVIFLTNFMVQVGNIQGILPDYAIAASFGADPTDIAWFPASYSLTSGTFMLAAGRLGDIYGHKKLYVVGWLWFALWSLLAGLSVYSRSAIFFDICRAMQGIGPAILVPASLAILGSVYRDGHRKNLAFALYAAGAPVGFTVGGVFAALLAQLAEWSWSYYSTAIVCAGLAGLASFAIPPICDKETTIPSSEGKNQFDYWGAFTGISGLILFNFAWNRAPAVGWQKAQAIAPLILGIILIGLFFSIEKKVSQPLLPINKLSKDAIFVLLVVGVGWSSFGIFIYYSVNFITQLRQCSLLSTAAQYVPVPFSGLAASLLTSFLLGRGVPTSYLLALSMFFFCGMNVLIAIMPVEQSYWRNMFWANVVAPFGMDISFPAATILISGMVEAGEQGIAASLVATVVYYSQSVGLGFAGTAEAYIGKYGGSTLEGYRAALYVGIGLSGVGILVGMGYVFYDSMGGKRIEEKRTSDTELAEESV